MPSRARPLPPDQSLTHDKTQVLQGSPESVDTLVGLILPVLLRVSSHVTAGAQAPSRHPQVGEENLIGSLQELVTTILAAGDPCVSGVAARPG
jgi:hypothetical protein